MEIFEGLRNNALSRIAHGDPSGEILADIAMHFMDRFPRTTAGVTSLDRTTLAFASGIFPTVSPAFGDALAGIRVADEPGSCARSVARGETVDVPDVPSDERFAPEWRDLCVRFGMTAMTSFPAAQRDGTVLGTFVVVYDPQTPLDYQTRRLAEQYAQLCGFILAYRRREDGHELIVGELEHRTRNLINTIGALVYSTLKANPEMERFRKVLDGRLSAMARAFAGAVSGEYRSSAIAGRYAGALFDRSLPEHRRAETAPFRTVGCRVLPCDPRTGDECGEVRLAFAVRWPDRCHLGL